MSHLSYVFNVVLGVVIVFLLVVVWEQRRRICLLKKVAGTDFLTGLPNRRSFFSNMFREVNLLSRFKRKGLAVLCADIDFFKSVNDRFTHKGGDEVLKAVASSMKRVIRRTDLIGRIGGEEFAFVLVDVDKKGAIETAEKIRLAVESLDPKIKGLSRVTISIGGAWTCSYTNSDLLGLADQALYQAKGRGRNQVFFN